jgi:hypothetical protein
MKRVIAFGLAALATLMVSTRAGAADQSDYWFGTGVAWYEHPCGVDAFTKYGRTPDPSPEVRDAYERTLKNPKLCAKLFP